MIPSPPPILLGLLGALLASLVGGTVTRVIALRNADDTLRRKRLASLRSWWIISLLLAAGLLAGRLGVCLLFAAASIIALREYADILGIRDSERPALVVAQVIAVAAYLLILLDQPAAFVVGVPVGALAILAVLQVIRGRTAGYIRTTGGLFFGVMVLVYGLAHAAYLFVHPASASGPAGPAGWLLFLLVLTESNDIFQALVGRSIGAHKRHRIAPTVSPNKTWEGFLGGLVTTLILAWLIAPWLTTLDVVPGPLAVTEAARGWVGPLAAGTVIAVAGLFGDLNMSGIKRDGGAKHSGTLLPGMGGLIDRVDSLSFTAPAFVYLLAWWMR